VTHDKKKSKTAHTSLSGGSKMRSVSSLVSRFSLPGWSPMYRMMGARRQGQENMIDVPYMTV